MEQTRRTISEYLVSAVLIILLLIAGGCTSIPASAGQPGTPAMTVTTTQAHALVSYGVTKGSVTATPTAETQDLPRATTQSPVGAIISLPGDAEGAATFMKNRVYEKKVSIYGDVSSIGEMNCPCFLLLESGTSVHVWYDMMVDADGKSEPAVSIKGLRNGNRALVTGVLKSGAEGGTRNDFWAMEIQKVVG